MAAGESALLERLERAVAQIEAKSDAEIVIVGKRFSGSYADIDFAWGMLAGGAVLLAVLFAPPEIPPGMVVPIVAAATALGVLASRRLPWLRRCLSPGARRRDQARREAKVTFFDENVAATRGRTGILFYFSELEGELVILPDAGIEGCVEPAFWNGLTDRFGKDPGDPRERLLSVLTDAGTLLAERVPAKPGENPDELESRPRWMH